MPTVSFTIINYIRRFKLVVKNYFIYYGVVGFYYNNTPYYYLKNIQGDVVGILDANGTQVVSYTYDAWGKLIETTGTLADTIGHLNPFRYRSYYYDSETELYYINTRYYDPETYRFLNADSVAGVNQDMNAYNIFAYCSNNPINCFDYNGQGKVWNWVKQQYNNCMNWFKSSSVPSDVVRSINKESTTQIVDSCIDDVLNVRYKPYVSNINFSNATTAVVKNTISFANNAVYKTVAPYASSLKAINKVGGITAAVSYGLNIYSDYNKYGGFTNDFFTAAAITSISTAICIGTGVICTGFGVPVGAAIITSVVVGVVASYYETEYKKQIIGY